MFRPRGWRDALNTHRLHDSGCDVWSENDVYGLAQDGDHGYVIEGWYLEYVSRVDGPHEPIHADMTRSPYFDRGDHGSGLLTWHFDYWRQSTTYFAHGNDAQNDPNRYQMDLVEFDRGLYEAIRDEFEEMLTGARVHAIPLSALHGDNVIETSRRTSW